MSCKLQSSGARAMTFYSCWLLRFRQGTVRVGPRSSAGAHGPCNGRDPSASWSRDTACGLRTNNLHAGSAANGRTSSRTTQLLECSRLRLWHYPGRRRRKVTFKQYSNFQHRSLTCCRAPKILDCCIFYWNVLHFIFLHIFSQVRLLFALISLLYRLWFIVFLSFFFCVFCALVCCSRCTLWLSYCRSWAWIKWIEFKVVQRPIHPIASLAASAFLWVAKCWEVLSIGWNREKAKSRTK